MADVRDYEPRLALDGGPDGLDVIRALIAASSRARKGIAIEVGQGQAERCRSSCELLAFRGRSRREGLSRESIGWSSVDADLTEPTRPRAG
jgi:release factor glutamine methyltransferase